MAPSTPREPIPFDSPATYQIIVQGRIDPGWSDRLEGMQISRIMLSTGLPATTLEGKLSDQAGLAGVLDTLYELHQIILLVRCLSIGHADGIIQSAPSS
jgi:hypothetical protein